MRALAVLALAAACPRAAALIVYYNVFSKSVATAVEIVYEQLTELRASPIWSEVEEIRYSTIGKGKMRNHPGAGEALNEQHGLRNVRANKRNFTTIMGEGRTLYGAVPPESSLLLRKYRQMYGVPAPGRRLLRSGRTKAAATKFE